MAAASEQKNRARGEMLQDVLFLRARGRCECRGLCGHNHAWFPDAPKLRCNAAHGVNIVRKKGHPSCIRNAPLQGFAKDPTTGRDMLGPRTHEPGQYVMHGIPVDFAHPEHFEMDKIGQIWLSSARVSQEPGEAGHLLMCQFCIHQARKKGTLQ